MTIRALVVEDSVSVRRRLCEVLAAAPDVEVVGEAGDGKRAIELCGELRPDVITLDMMLPVMTGLAATEYIMAYCPTPILIVSASTNRGELFKTYDALAAGAVDVLEKPRGDELGDEWEQRFIAAVKMVSRIRVITHPRARLGLSQRTTARGPVEGALVSDAAYRVVALGASTGGPSALVQVLRAMPSPLAVPILFVLHIAEPFGSAFADWLDSQTPHQVAYASDGESIESAGGRVAMAPPGQHLIVQNSRLRLTSEPERHSCRPSIDVLFESLARDCGSSALACLLTGMGRDGASGLLEIKRAGGLTIAQDEATSIVYGMPREAAAIGAAERVLPLTQIGGAIAQLVSRG